MNKTQTTGQQLAATLRRSFRVGPRTLDRRDGHSIKADMLESISNAVVYPGYYGEERTALSSAAWGAFCSYQKHVDGFRVDGIVRFQIMSMSPYRFAAMLGEMVDAGVTCTADGERFFREMARTAVAA